MTDFFDVAAGLEMIDRATKAGIQKQSPRVRLYNDRLVACDADS